MVNNSDNPDQHAKRRDIKMRKRNRPSDNRKSIQLIAKLSSDAKSKRKA